uniref:Uncharacterized protein n=1 Tax=Meloidogyne incognita TaxID=6306 RepID=A0A914MZI9_MELIC
MALIILNTPTFNVDEFEQPYNIPTKESEETFAFGYGINECMDGDSKAARRASQSSHQIN